MPTGVYVRRKGKTAPASTSKIATYQAKVAEYLELIRLEQSGERKRKNLLQHCERNEYGRSDLKWVIEHLPKERISKKDREAALASQQDDGRRKPRTKAQIEAGRINAAKARAARAARLKQEAG